MFTEAKDVITRHKMLTEVKDVVTRQKMLTEAKDVVMRQRMFILPKHVVKRKRFRYSLNPGIVKQAIFQNSPAILALNCFTTFQTLQS
jgi:hypothetical protein